jgi:hypothetical protein
MQSARIVWAGTTATTTMSAAFSAIYHRPAHRVLLNPHGLRVAALGQADIPLLPHLQR